MKLVVATYGTEGDTRPLAALCRALQDAGHEALLLADAATLGSARMRDSSAARSFAQPRAFMHNTSFTQLRAQASAQETKR